MPAYAITSARIDETNGRVTHVGWGRISTNVTGWDVQPRECPVIEVVGALKAGNIVCTIFREACRVVPGADVRIVSYPEGVEGIETVDTESNRGRTLADLPAIGEE
jgi:hypothetical protein